jgi:hypothetical protein
MAARNYRAPVPTDPTTQENLKQRSRSALLTVQKVHCMSLARAPTLHSRPGALIHIRGLFQHCRSGFFLFPSPLAEQAFIDK